VIRASNILRVGFVLALWCGTAVAAEPLPPETIGVAPAPVATPHRLYLTDLQIAHITDGLVHIVDGQSFKYLGMFSTGLFGITALTSDSSEMLVASTYYTKRNRGDRFDQLEAYDTKTFALKKEIQIPAKHAMALPYKGTIAPSVDDAWVFIQNATPLSSVTVVDHKAWKVTAEVPTLGCWIILPSQSNPRRFATLCGDGTLVTVTLNEKGDTATQTRSEKLFDPEKDPLFVQGERVGDTYSFVSYEGNVKVINVGGDVAKLEDSWSLLDEADKKGRLEAGRLPGAGAACAHQTSLRRDARCGQERQPQKSRQGNLGLRSRHQEAHSARTGFGLHRDGFDQGSQTHALRLRRHESEIRALRDLAGTKARCER